MVGSRARLFMGGVAVGAHSRKERLSRSVLFVGYEKSRGISERRSILERVFQYVSAYINGIFYFLFRSGSLGDGRLPAAFAGTFFVAFGVRDEKSSHNGRHSHYSRLDDTRSSSRRRGVSCTVSASLFGNFFGVEAG